MDLNKVILVGGDGGSAGAVNPGGQSVTTIGVAQTACGRTRPGRSRSRRNFITSFFGADRGDRRAISYEGAMVLIEGRLQTRSWTINRASSVRRRRSWQSACSSAARANAGGGSAGAAGASALVLHHPRRMAVIRIHSATRRDPGDNLEEDEIKPEDIPF